MFKKSERLSQVAFDAFFKQGVRHHTTYLTLITTPYPTRKVAVVVGKKVAKSAVKRNLLRRRIYAVLRRQLDELKFQGVLIVLAKPTFVQLSRHEAQAVIEAAVAEVVKST
ncbi:ribonuclease P protein component [Candidatus Kaiserbacteria bacterium]|nr:ribonuclease P protein component [Candidatus Kaiserbacteria bacterium]MCB9812401.1 ribonuclease P protein component [Candidatus Nomurabacteria bacterium]